MVTHTVDGWHNDQWRHNARAAAAAECTESSK